MSARFALVLLLCLPCVSLAAEPQTLDAWDDELGAADAFGSALAFSDDHLIVGATWVSAAYVFHLEGDRWVPGERLESGQGVSGSGFGSALAVHGSRLAVAAPGEPDGGAVYVFERTASTWSQVARLVPDAPQVDAGYGRRVAVHANRVAVSAPDADGGSGRVYVFERDALGEWTQTASLGSPSPEVAGFASGLAMSATRIAVTLPSPDVETASGQVLLYVRDENGTWRQEDLLQPGLDCGCLADVGKELLLDDRRLVFAAPDEFIQDEDRVNEGRVYVYDNTDSGWQFSGILRPPSPVDGARLGTQLAGNGTQLLVSPHTPAGDTYLYQQDNEGTWQAVAGTSDDVYMISGAMDRAMSSEWIAVGNPSDRDSKVYVHRLSDVLPDEQDAPAEDEPNEEPADSTDSAADDAGANAGDDTSTNADEEAPTPDGNTADSVEIAESDEATTGGAGAFSWLVMLPLFAARRVRTHSIVVAALLSAAGSAGAAPQQLLTTGGEPVEGSSAAVAGDVIVVGQRGRPSGTDPSEGHALVFQLVEGAWQQVARLEPPANDPGWYFGQSVATDGARILVGAPGENVNGLPASGAAYVWQRTQEGWSGPTRITPEDTRHSAGFGVRAAIDGETLMVGAEREATQTSTPIVVAYAFEYDNQRAQWQQTARFGDVMAATGTWGLVRSVDVSGNTLVNGLGRAGEVHVYEHDSVEWQRTATLNPEGLEQHSYSAGATVRIIGDTLVVTAPNHDAGQADDTGGVGRVYVYERSDGRWQLVDTLSNPDAQGGVEFGTWMAFGGNAIAVNTRAGQVTWLFERNDEGGWESIGSIREVDERAYPNIAHDMSADHLVLEQSAGIHVYALDELLNRERDADGAQSSDSGESDENPGDDGGNREQQDSDGETASESEEAVEETEEGEMGGGAVWLLPFALAILAPCRRAGNNPSHR